MDAFLIDLSLLQATDFVNFKQFLADFIIVTCLYIHLFKG